MWHERCSTRIRDVTTLASTPTGSELVTAALLGTERRQPPHPPIAPVADVVDDSVLADDAARMLATVSTVIAARRAAFVPLPPADRLQPPAPDTSVR